MGIMLRIFTKNAAASSAKGKELRTKGKGYSERSKKRIKTQDKRHMSQHK